MDLPIRIAIADDHAMFRQGLKSVLKLQPDVKVVAEAERADDIEPMLKRSPCDILLLDLHLDRSVFADIARFAARTKVIVLTANEHPEDAMTAIREGAEGVVLKRFAVDMLMDAVHTVIKGQTWLPAPLQTQIAEGLRGTANVTLTPRERDVIRLVALGLRNAEVAERLFISDETVKTHLNNIFRKLDLRDRVELTLYAARIGVVKLDQRLPDAVCARPPSTRKGKLAS
jgi:DNA-binding NarL/FixJ family response regulator